MSDLYFGLAIVAAAALIVFFLSVALARRLSPLQQTVFATMLVIAMVIYTYFVWQSTALVHWLPYSNLIVVGNWFPLFLAALAAVVSELDQLSRLRRGMIVAAIAGFASYAVSLPLLGNPPNCGNRTLATGETVQTTDFTCSAAAAATLLKAHGIPATEQEMAELCLTRSGTSWLGLYRGLKLKTAGTEWDVEVIECRAEELGLYARGPMVLEVGLEDDQHVDAAFRNEFGWLPGMRHSVVLEGFEADRARIVDPAPMVGREQWDRETLKLLWRGHGMRLVHRGKS